MSNGNQHRRDGNRDGKRSLHLAASNLGEMIEQVPGAAEFVAQVRHHPDYPKPLTDPIEVQEACLEILQRGKGELNDKIYEIFGGKFRWEMRDFPVIRFLGTLDNALFDVPGRKFGPGFFIPVNKLLTSADHLLHTPGGEAHGWDDLNSWEQFVVLLQSNTEMILAKEQFLDNQQRARQAQAAEAAKAGNANLTNILSKIGGKMEPLKLNNIAGILKTRFATFDVVDIIDGIESRVTLLVCKSHRTEGIIIRFKEASEGHPMAEMANQNMFVWQGDMVEFDGEDDSVLEGKALLARQAREWLRIKLREAGAISPAAPKLTVVGTIAGGTPVATSDAFQQEAFAGDSTGNVAGSEALSAAS